MALVEPTRYAPTREERDVDARLAGALDRVLGALEDRSPGEYGDEARPRGRLSYRRGRAASWWKLLGFLQMLGPRLLHSQRPPYRIPRRVAVWFAYGCVLASIAVVVASIAVMLARSLPLG
jgi:hypothetical protein